LLRGGELRVELGHLVLDLLRDAVGLGEVLLGDAREPVEPARRYRDLLRGGGHRGGKGLERALAVVERLVLAARIVGDEGEGAEHDRDGDANGDGDKREPRHRARRLVGDVPCRQEKECVPGQEDPLRQPRCVAGQIHVIWGLVLSAAKGQSFQPETLRRAAPPANFAATAAYSLSHSAGLRSRLLPGETWRWSVMRSIPRPSRAQRASSHSSAEAI